ncbi:LAFE_0F08658g1_1 [Lachancea fermentati]|uniref:LAFE_0F08658g1_1 n=1 Tax=Lachancea fermentati TaxID=4955 RepID=A0A1G4MF96_LACFM|nr:LAFE_0F08658g1_1 [Lachancea fermentati]
MPDQPSLIHRWSHTYSILSTVAFPHKKILFAGTHDSKILCFDLNTYNLIKTIRLGDSDETHTKSSVLCLAKSKDEKLLFSGGADSLVRIWSVGDITRDYSICVKELGTVYSLLDIGDIFSLKYLDGHQTIVFGCQNANMLYLPNVLDKIQSKDSFDDLNKLPHRRFDKFFDSLGPGSKPEYSRPASPDSVSSFSDNVILQVPSENIVQYAHNGFIYSIQQLKGYKESLPDHFYPFNVPNENYEFIVSGGGDGMNKVWALAMLPDSSTRIALVSELDSDDSVLCQFIEYPFLYCGLTGGIIKIWDLNTNELISTLHAPDSSDIMSLTVYQDHIFATQEKGITKFYQDSIYHWSAHERLVLSAEILRKACTRCKHVRLVTGGNDGTLALWDINNLVEENDSGHVFHYNASEFEELSQKDNGNSWVKYQASLLEHDNMLQTLKELISFKTVSARNETQYLIDARKCATFLQQLFNKFGAAKCELLAVENGGNPLVYALFKGNAENKSKILWYAHYDVISAGDPSCWNTDPFSLTCEDGYLKGRGVSDNKGPLVAAIYSVAELALNNSLPNDVVFLIEGQEESGSDGFANVVNQHIDLIGRDVGWILFSNSYWIDREIPCLNYGLRGVINAKITIWSNEPDRHSGVDGGVHREPTADLVRVISKLQDDEGNVLIPGFYESIKELSGKEYNHFKEIIHRADIDETITVDQLIAKWTKPSLSITTMKVSGPGNATVIPRKATISISIRLVPEQNLHAVRKSLEDYVQSSFTKLKSKNHMEIKILNEAEPWLGDPENLAYKVLKEEISDAWGIDPLLVREGGSIPQVRFLERVLDAPAAQIPCGQSTDNAHLDNEQLRIKNWYRMRQILGNVFSKL